MKAYHARRSKFGTIAILIGLAVIVLIAGSVFGWWDRAHSQELPPQTSPQPTPPTSPPVTAIVPSVVPVGTLCGPLEAISAYITREAPYPHAEGQTRGTSRAALLIATDRLGKFIVFIVEPSGRACLLAAGDGFEIIEKVLPPGRDS
jgi:hypothetical protein